MINLIKSEWIKLKSTKALWATSILVLLLSGLFAMMMGLGFGMSLTDEEVKKDPLLYAQMVESISPMQALSGFSLFGIIVIIIQACMTVTSEYGNGSAKTTLLATPKRWSVPVAKFVVYGIIAAIVAFLAQVISVPIARWALSWNVDDSSLLDRLSFSTDDTWRFIGLNCLYAVLVVMIAIGVSYLIRHTAGAISVLLMWILIVELMLVGQIPWVRDWLPPYLPFKNMDAAVQGTEVPDAPWGSTGSLIYFVVWALAIFIAGIVALKKRDA